MTRSRGRANGEGSIFPYRNGHAAYVWITTPTGQRKRHPLYALYVLILVLGLRKGGRSGLPGMTSTWIRPS